MQSNFDAHGRRASRRPARWLLIVLVLAVAGLGTLAWARLGEPSVEITAARAGIGRPGTEVSVHLGEPSRGLAGARVEVVQDGETTVVEERAHPAPRPFWAFWGPRAVEDTIEVLVGPETVPGLREGEATVRVVATRAPTPLRRGAPVVEELSLPVRLRPPLVTVLSRQHYVAQGGSGVVVYRVGEGALAEGGRDGVRIEVGEVTKFFPGYPLPEGEPGERFALFAAPHDLEDLAGIRLVAADDLGNEAQTAFVDQWFPHPPRQDTVRLSEEFMAKVVPEIMAQNPRLADQGDLLRNYLQINGDLRARNAQELRDLSERSRPRFLWHRAFQSLPGSQVMSSFADRRTYTFNQEPVDHQTHLGFDLASTRHAEVPAANDGEVLIARYFGIYGNTVVLDHGFGLMSLYSHLSSIDVEEGQRVERGQTLGRTGATGLAGGDHLHFTMMVRGEAVTPVEWWDEAWIRDRVASKLGAGFELRSGR